MFFFIALFAVGFILSAFLMPKMKIENAQAAGLDDFSFPRSKEGDPVPRFYGTLKHESPNTISINGFKAEPIKKKVKTGLFSSKKVTTGYKYYLTVDLAWALGPGVVYRRMWFGNNLVWAGCLYDGDCLNVIPINLPELYGGSEDGKRGGIKGQVAMYCGSFDQLPDPHLVSTLDPDVPGYVGIAHMVFRDFWWGNSPSIDTVAVEAAYLVDTLGVGSNQHIMENGLDMNAVCVLYDIFVTDWGNLGYDPAKINVEQWRAIARKIWPEQLGISISVANATEAKEAVKQILRQINGIIYEDQTTGLVELKLLRNDYNPALLPVLDPSDVVEVRNYTKKLWNETNNVVRVKYTDREDNYAKDKVAIAKDTSLLRFQGKERPVEVQMPGIFVAEVANAVAARELSNLNVPLYSCELVTKRTVTDLSPGDPFIFAWPEYGIVTMVMRIRKMNLGSLESGQITLSVVQDEYALDATVIAAPSPSGYEPTVITPIDISILRILEVPAFLDYQAQIGTREGYTRLMSFAVAPSSYTLGYDAFIEDGVEDAEVLSLASYSVYAELAADIPRFEGWADGTLGTVEIANMSSNNFLTNGNDQRQAGGLFAIGDELFSYTSFTDDGGGSYTLFGVKRAFLDTGWFAHTIGETVWFFDGADSFFDSDTPNGETSEVYLIDRTSAGRSDPESALVVPFTNKGRVQAPVAPDYATADASRSIWQVFEVGDDVTIDARPRSRLDVAQAWFENDAASTPEPGTTYKIAVETAGVETVVEDDVSLPYDLALTGAMTGQSVVLIYAKRDGVYSIAGAPMPIVIRTTPIMIDGVDLEIDGEKVYTT